MTPDSFVAKLARVNLENVFNPYADMCHECDDTDAPITRREGLRSYLQAAIDLKLDTVWMARDLGYRGGRRTGLALTDERHLSELPMVYPGALMRKSTRGPVTAERTATEIWSMLKAVRQPPLLWNVFPLHPHKPDGCFTNRKFAALELKAVDRLNWELFDLLQVRRIVAIGEDAARYAERFGLAVISIRHPSYGGTTLFRAGIKDLYEL